MALAVPPPTLVTMESSSWSPWPSSSHLNDSQEVVVFQNNGSANTDAEVEDETETVVPSTQTTTTTTVRESIRTYSSQQDQPGVRRLEKNFRTISLIDQQSSSSSSPPTIHQDDDQYVRHVRRNMISTLETLSRQKCQTNFQQHRQHNHQLVCQLERILWKQSKQNVTIYTDMSTLQGRLQSLMKIVLLSRRRKQNQQQGKQQQQQQQHSPSKNHHFQSSLSSTSRTLNSRDKLLVQLMGTIRYDRAVTLVRSIQDCKLQYMAKHTQSCCSNNKNNNSNRNDGTSACTMMSIGGQNSTCAATGGIAGALPPTLPTSMPDPVKNIYFATRLITVFEKASHHQLVTYYNDTTRWDDLLHEADNHLRSFRDWMSNKQK